MNTSIINLYFIMIEIFSVNEYNILSVFTINLRILISSIILYVEFVKFLNILTDFKPNTIKTKPIYIFTLENNRHATVNNSEELNFMLRSMYGGLIKQPYHKQNGGVFFNKIVNLNIKRGLKQKTRLIFLKTIFYIQSYFNNFDMDLNAEYMSYSSFFEFSRTFSREFYNLDFIFKYLYSNIELLFLIKKLKPTKKTKKQKSTPKYIISYISKKSRLSITLRVINSYINSNDTFLNHIRLGNSLLYLMLGGKNSFLYKKKLSLYTKLLEKKKFY